MFSWLWASSKRFILVASKQLLLTIFLVLQVEQSYRNRGFPSLFSQRLHVEILLGPSKEEVHEFLKGNSFFGEDKSIICWGYGSGRKPQKINRNVKSSSLIEPLDDPELQGLCLFLAIGLTVKYVKMQANENKLEKQTEQLHFTRLINGNDPPNKKRRIEVARGLLDDIRKQGVQISERAETYSIEEHAPLIQQYFYSFENPDERCRLIIFGPYGIFKPLFKGQRRARWDIPLFFRDGHFWGIRNVRFYSSKYLIILLK